MVQIIWQNPEDLRLRIELSLCGKSRLAASDSIVVSHLLFHEEQDLFKFPAEDTASTCKDLAL